MTCGGHGSNLRQGIDVVGASSDAVTGPSTSADGGDPWGRPRDTAPLTRAQWVDQRLREAILSGDLAPDERLITATLVERFSVSPTPLREALQRLSAEGLVEISPQRGARVAALSATDWNEIIELRELLEPVALRDSFDHASPDGLERMERARSALEESLASASATPLQVAIANRDLHDALLSEATSRQLARTIAILTAQSMRYHVLALDVGARDDLVLQHGAALRDTLSQKDAERGCQVLFAHLQALRLAARAISNEDSQVWIAP